MVGWEGEKNARLGFSQLNSNNQLHSPTVIYTDKANPILMKFQQLILESGQSQWLQSV